MRWLWVHSSHKASTGRWKCQRSGTLKSPKRFNFDRSFLMMFCSCTSQACKVKLMFQDWLQVTTCWCKNTLMWLLRPRRQFLPSYPLQKVMDTGWLYIHTSDTTKMSLPPLHSWDFPLEEPRHLVLGFASFFAPVGVGLLYCCSIYIHISRCNFRLC